MPKAYWKIILCDKDTQETLLFKTEDLGCDTYYGNIIEPSCINQDLLQEIPRPYIDEVQTETFLNRVKTENERHSRIIARMEADSRLRIANEQARSLNREEDVMRNFRFMYIKNPPKEPPCKTELMGV